MNSHKLHDGIGYHTPLEYGRRGKPLGVYNLLGEDHGIFNQPDVK